MEPLNLMKRLSLHRCDSTTSNRRQFLKTTAAAGMAWMNPLAQKLARCAENDVSETRGKAIILLWMAGGPSQLETFDPHPSQNGSEGRKAIPTPLKHLQLAQGLEEVAELMNDVSLIRSMVSQEGDHERAVYNVKTGYRPPSLGMPRYNLRLIESLRFSSTTVRRALVELPHRGVPMKRLIWCRSSCVRPLVTITSIPVRASVIHRQGMG